MGQWMNYLKKIRPYNIQKGIRYLKHYGVKEFMVRLSERMEPDEVPYGPWFEKHRIDPGELIKQREDRWKKEKPLISVVVPAYRTPKIFLEQMIESVREQSYDNWELCIANGSPGEEEMGQVLRQYQALDERIRVCSLEKNLGIAENTNAAFAMASGDFVGLLDHDDLLAPDALYEVAKAVTKFEDTDVVYTDEDKVTTDLTEHFQPHFKPDFSIDLLRSNNYITHFFVVRRTIVEEAGGFRKEYDGAQDYDFIFRCTETARRICHVPKVLYHWRTHRASTADNPASKLYAFEAGKRAIEGNLKRCGADATVTHTKDFGFYRVTYAVREQPLVSVIIPNKDHADVLKKCLDSVRKKTSYTNYEIIIAENNSVEQETFSYYRELEQERDVKIVTWEGEFNYSAINNFAVRASSGDYLLFLNNDVEVISDCWMEELLGNCQREEVGIAGAKLYYPDDTIQHAGTVIGIGGIAGHAFLNMPRSRTGYMHKASIQLNVSAVTAACMMMKRSVFEQLGGFEERLTVAFNDVDLCLRTVKAGYLIVYDPWAELYHYESKSRGAEDSEEKVRRFQTEIEFMRNRWIGLLKDGDPYYNRNLTLTKWNYSLRA